MNSFPSSIASLINLYLSFFSFFDNFDLKILNLCNSSLRSNNIFPFNPSLLYRTQSFLYRYLNLDNLSPDSLAILAPIFCLDLWVTTLLDT